MSLENIRELLALAFSETPKQQEILELIFEENGEDLTRSELGVVSCEFFEGEPASLEMVSPGTYLEERYALLLNRVSLSLALSPESGMEVNEALWLTESVCQAFTRRQRLNT